MTNTTTIHQATWRNTSNRLRCKPLDADGRRKTCRTLNALLRHENHGEPVYATPLEHACLCKRALTCRFESEDHLTPTQTKQPQHLHEVDDATWQRNHFFHDTITLSVIHDLRTKQSSTADSLNRITIDGLTQFCETRRWSDDISWVGMFWASLDLLFKCVVKECEGSLAVINPQLEKTST